MHAYRTHKCGQLRKSDEGTEVRLSGWIHRKRDHGGVLFIDLRDTTGITQCVVDQDNPQLAEIEKWRPESVITISGKVKPRHAGTENAKMPTGAIELYIEDAAMLSPAEVLPLQVADEDGAGEDIRLKYRFLDLRREGMHSRVRLRNDVISSMRRAMWDQGFQEFNTPIMTASSPEGARDYLVPSRLHPGKFYALPQAPQQFKQLLMVAGFDRYFQIAPCFRDEDGRADRLAEFYQLDIEMSFVTQEEVFATMTPVVGSIFEKFNAWTGKPHRIEWLPNMRYADALLRYGSDKPDLRNPLVIADVTDVFRREDVTFNAFKSVIASGGVVRAIRAPNVAALPRSFFDKLNDWARGEGAPGLGYIAFEEGPLPNPLPAGEGAATDGTSSSGITNDSPLPPGEGQGEGAAIELPTLNSPPPDGTLNSPPPEGEGQGGGLPSLPLSPKGPIAKFLPPPAIAELAAAANLAPGDAVFFVCDKPEKAAKFAGRARDRICDELPAGHASAREQGVFKLFWLVDFPMYELDEKTGKIDFSHNPFSEPRGGLAALEGDPLEVVANQYDCVCNGYELCSGGIRNNRPDVMEKAFALAGYDRAVLEKKFGGMLNAFKYGAPPHGGCAFGIDRIVMLLANEPNLREVYAFVMNGAYEDLMMGAPSEPTPEQMRDLHLKAAGPTKLKGEAA